MTHLKNMKIEFQDINFKLCVIQELMYNQNVIGPPFDIYKFAENHKDRRIDIDEEGYEIIPEAFSFFKELEIPTELLANITEIYQDGGNDIYMQICPFWSGQDDQFNITNTADVSLLPNLKKMTIFYGEDKTILDNLKQQNIDAEYL
jgi:hypothetical protein